MKILILILDWLVKLAGGEKTETQPSPIPQDAADIPEQEVDIMPAFDPELEETEITSRFHWILDPGHGPKTKGKRSPPLPEDGYVFFEYEYNHDIARRVSLQLTHFNISHSQTVQLNENMGNALEQRVKTANDLITNKPKRFVSIHANAARTKESASGWREDVEGTETFIHTNASFASEEMAKNFNDRISTLLFSTDRGVKTANYYVLRYTNMPACLIEVDFFTNPAFVRLSRSDDHRDAVASAIVASILELEAFSELPIA